MVPWIYELLRLTFGLCFFGLFNISDKVTAMISDRVTATVNGIGWSIIYQLTFICIFASAQLHPFKTLSLVHCMYSFLKLIYDCVIDNNPLMIYVAYIVIDNNPLMIYVAYIVIDNNPLMIYVAYTSCMEMHGNALYVSACGRHFESQKCIIHIIMFYFII